MTASNLPRQRSPARRPAVLVFSGLDPSGGAGIGADIEAMAAFGVHALPVVTALTVQDNDRVLSLTPVDAVLLRAQAMALIEKIDIAAVKIGVVGNAANASVIAAIVQLLRRRRETAAAPAPVLPVVLDPVLASGKGDALARGNAVASLGPLFPLATLVTPNLPEAAALCPGTGTGDGVDGASAAAQAILLRQRGCGHVLIKGGHAPFQPPGENPVAAPEDGHAGAGARALVVNQWFHEGGSQRWQWPRLAGEFHGSGCTLASAIAALLADGQSMAAALELGQRYCQHTLETAYTIADGQRIPNRTRTWR